MVPLVYIFTERFNNCSKGGDYQGQRGDKVCD